MTIDNADDFYDLIVNPTCNQYLKNFPGSTAHAVNACMAIYHMGDWYVVQKGMNNSEKDRFYNDLKDNHPYIGYAGKIINCAKHADRPSPVKLRREREELPDILNDTIYMAHFIAAEMPNGDFYDVRDLIAKGHAYWKIQLGR